VLPLAGLAALAGASMPRARHSHGGDETAVSRTIEDLRKAMLAADQAGLEAAS